MTWLILDKAHPRLYKKKKRKLKGKVLLWIADDRWYKTYSQVITNRQYSIFDTFDFASDDLPTKYVIDSVFIQPEHINNCEQSSDDCSGISNITCLNSHPLTVIIFQYIIDEIVIKDEVTKQIIYNGPEKYRSLIIRDIEDCSNQINRTIIQFEVFGKFYYIIDGLYSCLLLKGKTKIIACAKLISPFIKEAIRIYSTTHSNGVEEILLDNTNLYPDVISIIKEYLDVIPDKMRELYSSLA